MDAGTLAGGFRHAPELSDVITIRSKSSGDVLGRAREIRESHGRYVVQFSGPRLTSMTQPLPPSFESNLPGLPGFHATITYSLSVVVNKSKSSLFSLGNP